MADKKTETASKETSKELKLDDLEQVTGGSLKNASSKSTSRISKNTSSKL